MKLNPISPGFVRLDESRSFLETQSSRTCSSCNRCVKDGLSRDLKEYQWCCVNCIRTEGASHSDECIERYGHRQDLSIKGPSLRVATEYECAAEIVSLKLASSALNFRMDLDLDTARAILDSSASLNCLPHFDDKRLLLLFSRFSTTGTIRYPRSREFLYTAFKKMHRFVRAEPAELGIHRYFFVLRGAHVNKKYRFKRLIGQGSFGVVHRVVHIASGQERVCKTVRKGNSSLPPGQLESEIRIIARLDHPNVVRMYEFFQEEHEVHLIQEFCNGGDLLKRIKHSIKQQTPMPHRLVANIVRQILAAVAFMSHNRTLHKDLKCENVMLVEDGSKWPTVKVIDFGLSEISEKLDCSSTTIAGTAFYMAPEIFRPPFTDKCDIWSCGVITFFMLTGFLPFFGATVEEVKSYVLYRRLQWPAAFAGGDSPLNISDCTKDFVEKMLEKDAKLRFSAREAMSHPWLIATHTRADMRFSSGIAKNILDFSKLSIIKRALINLAAHIWEFRQMDSLRELFTELDTENHGFVQIAQLAGALQRVGVPDFDAWKAAKSLDLSNTGKITFTALIAGIAYPLVDSHKRIIKSLFETFSPDKRGKVAVKTMWDVLCGHRCVMNEGGSALSFEEFRLMMQAEVKVPSNQNVSLSIKENISPLEIGINDFRKWLLDSQSI